MTLPNFFIVGAPKAGTDALYYDLLQHPEIYMSPVKEPCYFSTEVRLQNFEEELQPQVRRAADSMRRYLADGMPGLRFGGIVSEYDDYVGLFSRVTDQKAIGEGSVCYLWSETAAAGIAAVAPRAKIIIVLMNPAERAFHQYLKSVSDGTVGHSFGRHLDYAFQTHSKLGVYDPFLAFGNYCEQVRRYVTSFPADQISISLFEDAQRDHQEWFSSILCFLGVDPEFIPQRDAIPSDPHVPRMIGVSHALKLRQAKALAGRLLPNRARALAKGLIYRHGTLPKMNAGDRARLVDYYREDIVRLQELIGRDLSEWLR